MWRKPVSSQCRISVSLLFFSAHTPCHIPGSDVAGRTTPLAYIVSTGRLFWPTKEVQPLWCERQRRSCIHVRGKRSINVWVDTTGSRDTWRLQRISRASVSIPKTDTLINKTNIWGQTLRAVRHWLLPHLRLAPTPQDWCFDCAADFFVPLA